jgi:hypothetical protein
MSNPDLMTACPACSKPVSKAAVACPHCGNPIRKARRPRPLLLLLTILFLGLPAGLLMLYWTDSMAFAWIAGVGVVLVVEGFARLG